MTRLPVLTLFAAAFLAGPATAQVPSKVVEKTLPLAADGRLVLHTYKGRVTVTTWDRAEAHVRAVVRPDGECDDSAELVERTRVEIGGGGREVRVVSDYDDLPKLKFRLWNDCGSRPFVEYDVRVPRTAALDIEDYKSRISVEGVAGDVAIESYKGVLRLKGLSGRLEVETYKGDARAELDRVSGDVRLETYKGEIDLAVPKGSRFDVDEEVGRRGFFEVSLDDTRSGPRLSVETYKGTIRLRER